MNLPIGSNQDNPGPADLGATDKPNATPTKLGASEDAVMEVLGEFQAGVESLKSLYSQRVAMTADLKMREVELKEQIDRVNENEARIKEQQADLAQMREACERERRETQQQREAFERSQTELTQRQAELSKATEELAQQRKAIESSQESSNARDAKLRDQTTGLEITKQRAAELQRELAHVRESAAAEATASAQAAEAHRGEVAASRKSVEDLNARFSQLADVARLLKEQIKGEQEKSAGLQEVLDDQVQVLANERVEVRKLTKELTALKANPGDGKGASGAEIQKLTQSFETERTQWQTQLSEQLQANTAASKAEADCLREELESLRKDQGGTDNAAKARLEKAAQFIQSLRLQAESQKTEIDALQAAIVESKSALEHAQHAAKAATDAKINTGSADEVWTKRRRERLRRARVLVRQQDSKIKKAGDVLRTRFEQCEQVLALRTELISARDSINAARRRTEQMKAKGKTAAVLFYSIGAFFSIGALSWVTTGFVTPGVFAANTTLKAESRNRELNSAEFGEWQLFHEQMLNDPRFHELAAERMSRRGMTSLATPGAIGTTVKNDLRTRPGSEGEMVIELHGEGSERTARVLETLTTALASQANASRQQRVDGAVTVITQPAKSTEQPIDNTRMLYAAAGWAGGTFLSLIVGIFIWRRMLSVKHTFENQARVDELLDGAQWSMPTITGPLRSIVPVEPKARTSSATTPATNPNQPPNKASMPASTPAQSQPTQPRQAQAQAPSQDQKQAENQAQNKGKNKGKKKAA